MEVVVGQEQAGAEAGPLRPPRLASPGSVCLQALRAPSPGIPSCLRGPGSAAAGG